jgi:hypothetical protein
MKELRSFELSECVKLPATWRNIPKDQNPQQLKTLFYRHVIKVKENDYVLIKNLH